MGLESASFLNDLNTSNPVAADTVAQGDDHLRLLKTVLKASFPLISFARYVEQPRADVADSATPAAYAATTNYINLLGSTTITGFDSNTSGQIKLVRLNADRQLTHNTTTLDLPGAANIAGKAGDHFLIMGRGTTSNRIIWYQKNDGKALVESNPIPFPSQTGNSGKDLTTDGSSLSFAFHPPIGSIVMWPTEVVPTGWLELDGSAVSRATYAALFSLLASTYGAGDGSTTFNLPDMRGKFARGWAHGNSNDPDRASRTNRGDSTTGDHVGTNQAGTLGSHTHTISNAHFARDGSGPNIAATNFIMIDGDDTGGGLTIDQPILATGGAETRPINMNLMYIIRAL